MRMLDRTAGVLLLCGWLPPSQPHGNWQPAQAIPSALGQSHPIEVLLSQAPANLGHPTVVSVRHNAAFPLRYIHILQHNALGGQFYTNENHDFVPRHIITGDISDDGTSQFVRSDATTSVYQIVPLQPGRLELQIAATFADGATDYKNVAIDVSPTSQDLVYFRLNSGFTNASITLTGDPRSETLWLNPTVQYSTLRYQIYLSDSTAIKLGVEQPTNAAGERILLVDPNGQIHGLHPGTTTIVGAFAGFESRLIVTVHP